MTAPDKDRKLCGLMVSDSGKSFTSQKTADGVLTVKFGDGSVTFFDDRIEILSGELLLYSNSVKANVKSDDDGLSFEYKGNAYRLSVRGAVISERGGNIALVPTEEKIILYPKTNK